MKPPEMTLTLIKNIDGSHRLLKCLFLWLFFIVCVTADCPKPDVRGNVILTNQALLQNNFPDDSNATYTCAVGYVRVIGSGVIICRGGQWTELTLQCEKKSCGAPGEVLNGRFDLSEGIEFGAYAKVVCDEGHRTVGQSYMQCLANGWSGRIPVCEVVKCERPAEIPNGKMKHHKFDEFPKFRDVVEYVCNDDYVLVGAQLTSCSANGTFYPPPPECRDVTCPVPDIQNAKRVGGSPPYKHKSFVTYQCEPNYIMNGSGKLICEVDGWSFPYPSCVAEIKVTTTISATTRSTTTSHSTQSVTTESVLKGGGTTDEGGEGGKANHGWSWIIPTVVVVLVAVVCCVAIYVIFHKKKGSHLIKRGNSVKVSCEDNDPL